MTNRSGTAVAGVIMALSLSVACGSGSNPTPQEPLPKLEESASGRNAGELEPTESLPRSSGPQTNPGPVAPTTTGSTVNPQIPQPEVEPSTSTPSPQPQSSGEPTG
ncbi:hypothetical protein [Spirillospora sp. CA-294931]|uniref:hypothetical protein n=1 Tax=Spirillospora sp. CA-294931 TaxID=3240042 RepID=UPI003D94F00B